MSGHESFAAYVLAGTRPGGDPVALAHGVASKAQVEVGGRALLLRVLDALAASDSVTRTTVVGLPAAALEQSDFAAALQERRISHAAGAASPAASVAAVLAEAPAETPVLVTTGDHALLSPAIVEGFLTGARAAGGDVAYGLAPYELVDALLPGMRRTVLRFRDGAFCGCNLFAFQTPRARSASAFWRRLEAHRKRPATLARMLGPLTLLRYLTRRLSLAQAFDRLSALSGADIRPVVLPFGEAAVDVDKPEDLPVAETLLARPGTQSPVRGSQSSSAKVPLDGS
jgi:2-C-methyl-D-erythritol 4-phosphate cytidylyltransferase